MILSVEPDSPVPAYEQLRSQIQRMILGGTLVPGSRLPTIRQLAADLGLSKATVSRTYEALMRERVVESRGRHGTVVTETTPPPSRSERERRVRVDVDQLALAGHQLGLTRAQLHTLLDRALDQIADTDSG